MYQALYRKWRPKTFEDVVGQEPITTTLKNEIRQGRPAHAYLLMGSRGTGKTTCAKLIAKAVNCLNPVDGSPCGVCDICRGIDNGSMVDVVEIDAASNNGVDNIRDLREEANFLPNVTKFRIYIIDEAHMLSIGAVNALLKIMEEPPEHVIFILATTEVNKIPATIQSRCQRFDFRRIGTQDIAGLLERIAGKEGISLEPDAAQLIAKLADGGARDALSLLDLCYSHSREITVATVSVAAGLIGQEYLFDLTKGVSRGDLAGTLELINTVGGQAVEYDRLCSQWVAHFRNLLIAATSKTPEELIVCLPETLKDYKAQAKAMTPGQMIYAIRVLQEAQNAMTRTASRRTELEIAAAKLCDPRLSQSPEALLARLDRLEARLNEALAGGIAPAPAAAAPAKEAPPDPREAPEPAPAALGKKPPAPKRPESPGDPAPFPQWEEVLERLGKANPAAKGALTGSKAYLAGGRMLIASENPVFREMMKNNEYTRESIKKAIAEVTGTRYGIGPYTGPGEAKEQPRENPLEEVLRQAREAGVPVDIR